MRRGHKLVSPTGLEMPAGLDASGVPCEGFGHAGGPLETIARVAQPPSGLALTSMIASVEAVAVKGEAEWLMWGCVADRPVLFATDSGTAAEMASALRLGEHATAILDPSQLLLQRLD
jgi:hypothetical protein